MAERRHLYRLHKASGQTLVRESFLRPILSPPQGMDAANNLELWTQLQVEALRWADAAETEEDQRLVRQWLVEKLRPVQAGPRTDGTS